jgi:hypothetical protein
MINTIYIMRNAESYSATPGITLGVKTLQAGCTLRTSQAKLNRMQTSTERDVIGGKSLYRVHTDWLVSTELVSFFDEEAITYAIHRAVSLNFNDFDHERQGIFDHRCSL